jgi:hypothetical protein
MYTAELPQILQSRFVVVQLLGTTGLDSHYKMPHYTLLDNVMVIKPLVWHKHTV